METELETETTLDSLLKIIDTTLSDIKQRELVSASEMSDVLLDMRVILTN